MFLEKYFTQTNILGEMNKKITMRKHSILLTLKFELVI